MIIILILVVNKIKEIWLLDNFKPINNKKEITLY
jgi:hypothetical protein